MRSTVVPTSKEDLSQLPTQERQKSFNEAIEQSIGNHSKAAAYMISQKPSDDKDIYHTVFFFHSFSDQTKSTLKRPVASPYILYIHNYV